MNQTEKPILNVLAGKRPSRNPIWLMRQAGRYLPEYRELRSKAKNFLNLCLTPEWATEITLQPIRRFDFDAAILFADILLIPNALGQKLEFREGEGPQLEPLTDEKAIANLSYDDGKMAPVYETLRRVKTQLPEKTALIGFCGAPWTVACYMIDGNSRNQFAQAKGWKREKSELMDQLLAKLIDSSEIYLNRQIEAGAEVIQIFDSWAGAVKGEYFETLVIEPTRELVGRLKKKYPHVPIIGFPREAGEGYRDYVAKTGVDGLSIDQFVAPEYAKNLLQGLKPLQGNLDPALLVRGGKDMQEAAENILKTFGPLHIFNLGHGVVPETPPEHVAELVKIVRNFKHTT